MKFSWKEPMFIVLLVHGCVSLVMNHIDSWANNWGGYDGLTYSSFATDFFAKFKTLQIAYYGQRIAPCFFAYLIKEVLSLPSNLTGAAIAFRILNFITFSFSIIVIQSILKILKFDLFRQWLAFIILFINFYYLKFQFYYPNLTDYFIFFISCLSFYAYLKNKSWLQIIAMVAGVLTWPSFFYFSAPLLLFTYKGIKKGLRAEINKKIPTQHSNQIKVKKPFALSTPVKTVISVLIFIVSCGAMYYYLYLRTTMQPQLFALLGLISTGIIFAALSWNHVPLMVNLTLNSPNLLKSVSIKGLVASVAIFIGLQVYIHSFKNTENPDPAMLYHTLIHGTQYPFLFFVTTVFYCGFIAAPIIFSLFFPHKIADRFGIATLPAIVLTIFLIISAESRHVTNYYVFFVIMVLETEKNYITKLPQKAILIFLTISGILLSRMYLDFSIMYAAKESIFHPELMPNEVTNLSMQYDTIAQITIQKEGYMVGVITLAILVVQFFTLKKKWLQAGIVCVELFLFGSLMLYINHHDKSKNGEYGVTYSPEVYDYYGRTYFNRGQYDSAIYYLLISYHKDSGDLYALGNIGAAYLNEKKYVPALTYDSLLLKQKPGDKQTLGRLSVIHNEMGGQYMNNNEPDKALNEFLLALKIDSNSAYTLHNIGIFYSVKGNLDKAKTYYEKALLNDPKNEAFARDLQMVETQLK